MKQLSEHGPCSLCGSENPHNIGIHWFVNEKDVVSSEFTLRLRASLRAVADAGAKGAAWPRAWRAVRGGVG